MQGYESAWNDQRVLYEALAVGQDPDCRGQVIKTRLSSTFPSVAPPKTPNGIKTWNQHRCCTLLCFRLIWRRYLLHTFKIIMSLISFPHLYTSSALRLGSKLMSDGGQFEWNPGSKAATRETHLTTVRVWEFALPTPSPRGGL